MFVEDTRLIFPYNDKALREERDLGVGEGEILCPRA
jgi:hypothetical protein